MRNAFVTFFFSVTMSGPAAASGGRFRSSVWFDGSLSMTIPPKLL